MSDPNREWCRFCGKVDPIVPGVMNCGLGECYDAHLRELIDITVRINSSTRWGVGVLPGEIIVSRTDSLK